MKKKIDIYTPKENIIVFIKSLISSVLMAIVVKFVYGALNPYLVGGLLMKVINLGIGVASGVLVYAIVMYFMKIDEYTMMINLGKNSIKSKLKKK